MPADRADELRDSLKHAVIRARSARVALAAHDPNVCMPLVLRDEETGTSIVQTSIQADWHRLADEHKRLVLWSHVESGKTQQLSIGRTIFELGRNPQLRCVLVSNTIGQSVKLLRAIAKHIESNEAVHAIWPHLKPSSNNADPWTAHAITVERDSFAKDPSVQAIGVHGSIVGARIDLLILDDVLDYENTRTEHLREDLRAWVYSTLLGRLTAQARVICVGNPYHPDDLLHYLERQPSWTAKRYPVLDESGETVWPDRWPAERLREKEAELGPLEYARQMLCQPRSDEDARFKRSWIELCCERGNGRNLVDSYKPPPGSRVYTGVDLAVGTGKRHDMTALVTVVRHQSGDLELLNIQAGRWTADEIMRQIALAHHRYTGDVMVEDVAAQGLLVQLARASYPDVPIRPFTTTAKRKRDPRYGVEAMAASFAAGRWIIPSGAGGKELHQEVRTWIDEMLYYDPRVHTGDRLMASWFAWDAARREADMIGGFRFEILDGGRGADTETVDVQCGQLREERQYDNLAYKRDDDRSTRSGHQHGGARRAGARLQARQRVSQPHDHGDS